LKFDSIVWVYASTHLGGLVSIVTRLRVRRPGVRFPTRAGVFFIFTTASRPALGAHPPSYPVGTGVKRLGLEAEHSSPYSAGVKNEWRCTSNPPIRLHGVMQWILTLAV
jgi:hypothetical protein